MNPNKIINYISEEIKLIQDSINEIRNEVVCHMNNMKSLKAHQLELSKQRAILKKAKEILKSRFIS